MFMIERCGNVKRIFKLFFVLSCFFLFNNIYAKEKIRIEYNDLNLRSGPGTNYSLIKKLGVNQTFDLVDKTLYPNEKGCVDGWYKIYYSEENVGYVCADPSYVSIYDEKDTPLSATTDCEKEMESKGFPNTYWNDLCYLKEKHPNWNFTADLTGLPFATVVEKESVIGTSFIQSNNEGYFNTDEGSYDYLTDTFKVMEGSNWYAASSEVVAYYLDPRNFLTERYIFMFEKLSFDESYQSINAIEAILNGKDIKEKASVIFEAGKSANANAIYLASRIKQETGGNYTGNSLKGSSITVNNKTYYPVYNPYNIGANTGVYDGLVWAVSGTSYLRPWLSLDNAIKGGASFITNRYISKGQDTSYFQKFNVSSYSSYSAYSNQYMTNIRGAANEASITYDGYDEMGLLSTVSYNFVIPVYDNMPTSTSSLPNGGNPNNHLKSITINDNELSGFSHNNFTYNYYASSGINKIKIGASVINSKASVTGTGDILLNSEKTTVTLKVTAENGKVQDYVINIIKTDGINAPVSDIVSSSGVPTSESTFILTAGYTVDALKELFLKTCATVEVTFSGKTSGLIATGDVVTIKNGSDEKSYSIAIKGDTSGDANITIADLLKVQKHILGYINLSGSFLKSADVNSDGQVDIKDLLIIQKHILGYTVIK